MVGACFNLELGGMGRGCCYPRRFQFLKSFHVSFLGLEKQLLARASTPSVAKPDPDSFDSDHFAPDSDTEKKTGVDLDRNASGYAEESDIVANPLVQRIDEPLKNH